MESQETTTQKAYNLYITETAESVIRAVNLKTDDPAEIGEEIRDQIYNSDWYTDPLSTIQFAETDPTDPKYTPRWAELADDGDITWEKALEEAVYICLFNDIMSEIKAQR